MRQMREQQVELVPPHGGKLNPLLITNNHERQTLLQMAAGMKSVTLLKELR